MSLLPDDSKTTDETNKKKEFNCERTDRYRGAREMLCGE